MKNKNIHKFGIETPLFHEGRRVFQTGSPETPEQMEARVGQERAVGLITLLRNQRDLGTSDVDILGEVDSQKFLLSNPFRHALVTRMATFDMSAISFNMAEDKPEDGTLIIHYIEGGDSKKFELTGLAYVAIMWGRIEPELSANFVKRPVPHAVMTKLAETNNAHFLALVTAISKSQGKFGTGPNDTTLVAKVMEAARNIAPKGGAAPRARAHMRGKENRAEFRNTTDQKLAEFLREGRASSKLNVGFWNMSVQGRSNEIDPKRWSFTSKAGIAKLKSDWQTLGIINSASNEYFERLLKVLERSHDSDGFLKSPGMTPERKLLYANPIDVNGNIDERIGTLTDPAYEEAVRYFKEMKDTGVQHDNQRANTLNLIHKQGQEPVTTILGNAIRDNAVVFRDALRNGDWTTAGAYVLGLWAMYQAYDGMEGKNKTNFSKWAFRGAALYAAHLLAKNAGYDVLKKLGISDVDEELKGTSLEALYDIIPEMKNVNSGIVSRMAMTNIGDLYSNYLKTNDSKKHRFVDPALFGLEFKDEPAFARLNPSDVYDKSNLKGVKAKYFKTGQQLYLLVEALESAYDKTLKPTPEMNYKSFGEAVLGHPVYSKSTIMDFTIALRNYRVNYRPDKSKVLGVGEAAKLKSRLDTVFSRKNMGHKLEAYEEKSGVFPGFLMGFPVLYLRDESNGGFHVVPQHEYKEGKGNFNVLGKRIAFIPFEGDASGQVQQAKYALMDRMKDRLTIFQQDNRKSGVNLSDVRWDDGIGRWIGIMTYNRMSKIPDANPQPINVYVTPGKTGKGLEIKSHENETLVLITNLNDKEGARHSLMLAHLVNQRHSAAGVTDFSPLKWFMASGNLTLTEEDPQSDFFEIKIGAANGGKFVKIKFDPSTGIYSFVPTGVEQDLLKDPDFQMGLSDAIGEERFKDIIEEFTKSINKTDESYLIHFFKSIPGWFTNGTWDYMLRGVTLDSVRGSIVKNYAIGLVHSQRDAMMAKFRRSMPGAGSFRDLVAAEQTHVKGGMVKMNLFKHKYDQMTQKMKSKGEKYSADDFHFDVMRELMGLGLESNSYKQWYRTFVNKVYAELGSDTKNNSRKAARIISIYAEYTAVIDKKEIDVSGGGFRFSPKMIEFFDLVRPLVKASPTGLTGVMDSQITVACTAAGIVSTDLPLIRRDYPKYIAQKEHAKAKNYADHVGSILLSKMGEYGDDIPDVGYKAWGILDYEAATSFTTPGDYELVDNTPLLSMSNGGDTITLDLWLKMDAHQRARSAYTDKDVILPRSNVELVFDGASMNDPKFLADQELYNKLWLHHKAADKANVNPRMTPLETAFRNKVEDLVEKFRDKFGEKWGGAILPTFDDIINNELRLVFNKPEPLNPQATNLPFKIDFVGPKSAMAKKIHDLETKIYTTTTGTQQNMMIDQAIEQYFRHAILSESVFHTYFHKTGKWEEFKLWLRGIKEWLFGRS